MLIEDLQVILKVAECRSITAAATQLDMRVATASAAVKRVESVLGVELFIRTTRQLRLSNAGERYLPQCEQALLMLAQAKQNVKEDLDIVDGEVRIALSSDLGRNVILPWLDEFMDTHPDVRLRASISDSNIDFYRDSVDMALRYGSPTDANVYGFKICNVPRVLCATQDYLMDSGLLEGDLVDSAAQSGSVNCGNRGNRVTVPLQKLQQYNALLYQLNDVLHDVWVFSDGEREQKIKVRGDRASNDADLVRRWCVSGKGLASKSSLDMAADLLAGRVISLDLEIPPEPSELWLLFPSRQSITPAARLLRDMLQEKCRALLNQLVEKGILDKKDLI
ncbi:LysR family transcriptional regulator [Enterovibrio norvegicus FF-33]|uniref:LysR family transcriptional regulator n=1 Tax=Enterovibrio TaxID=188143 RepID=UPI0002E9C8C8|nr:LysR family transcriptional regulator [Enterovibrio norvegicus]OEE67356.1 LysR family transcriptional regulator [Enterovibrio norvegicus FF-33]